MFSQRGLERLAAVVLLLTVVAFVVSVVTYAEPIDTSRDEIPLTLEEIDNDSGLFVTSTAFFIIASLLLIPLSAALYLAFRAHDRTLALFGCFGFLTAGVLNAGLAMARFALHPLAEDFAGAGEGSILSAIAISDARVLGQMIDIMSSMGGMGVALGVLAFGLIIARTGAMPRWIGSAGMLAALVITVSWIEFAHEKIQGILFIGLLIGLIFAMLAGFSMLFQQLRKPEAQAE